MKHILFILLFLGVTASVCGMEGEKAPKDVAWGDTNRQIGRNVQSRMPGQTGGFYVTRSPNLSDAPNNIMPYLVGPGNTLGGIIDGTLARQLSNHINTYSSLDAPIPNALELRWRTGLGCACCYTTAGSHSEH